MAQKSLYTRVASLASLVAAVLLSSAVARADIYKCSDGKGGLIFQQKPCTSGGELVIKERSPYRERLEHEAAQQTRSAEQEAATALARIRWLREHRTEPQKEASTPTPAPTLPSSIADNPEAIMLWCGRQVGISPKAYLNTIPTAQWQALSTCMDRNYMKKP
jgi:uncharacterized protein DUF4124